MNSDNKRSKRLPEEDAEFEALIRHVKEYRGFDFTGYKRTTLKRRIDRRMQTLGLKTYNDYIDYLEVHSHEYVFLFNTVLINVTSFFRDQATWDFVNDEVLPKILDGKSENDYIRVWSAGCATGQEAYTIAMLLAEKLGIAAFARRVKIYATDVDEDALQTARQACYSVREVTDVPEEFLKKYFDLQNETYTFNKELRRSIIFGRHDLVQDAPISRIDLLCCRNTLMYFNAETQYQILRRFQFALSPHGFLLLGKAEMLLSYSSLFTSFDLKYRIFTKNPATALSRRAPPLTPVDEQDEEHDTLARYMRFREIALDNSPVGQIVIDLNGFLVMANERGRALLNITPDDLGRMLQDLDLFHRVPDLRAAIDEVYRERRLMALKDVRWETISGDVRYLEIQLLPLNGQGARPLGVSLSFVDMTTHHLMQEEIENTNQALETAYEELQSTNEELQSTIEELETTNEELQSTNEELETINEELQSTNEELQTINDEANSRSDELHRIRLFLESILRSMAGGVVVLNTDFIVQIWNHNAEDLWGLRRDEVIGKNFLNLDIGLPLEKLAAPMLTCLAGEGRKQQFTVQAINRRGKTITCAITCNPLFKDNSNEIIGVIMVMEAVGEPDGEENG